MKNQRRFQFVIILVILAALIMPEGRVAHAFTGVVAPANSIIGSNSNDQVGSGGVIQLPNGNVVIDSPHWNGNRGAVTCLTPAQYQAGNIVVSAANSVVGSTANDQVGNWGVTPLTNSNYVISSYTWHNGAISNAGAATWANGNCSTVGAVSAANSLVGSTANDVVSDDGVTVLTNGNYVVRSPNWRNGAVSNAGAATWGNGTTGITGTISAANSLVGTTANDSVGSSGVTALTNGNYVVRSIFWNNGAITRAGAATWGNGTTGIVGAVSAANSLVGSTASDYVSNEGVTALTNGNYVVSSYDWSNGAVTFAGAATWGNGTTGITGTISAANSLVGSTNDGVSFSGVTALSNGNYVVSSPYWTGGGAATWGDGTTGISGTISAANSLIGSTPSDQVSSQGITALTNGNYVVISPGWDNVLDSATSAGAATWGNGTTGIRGTVSATNSLVGSTTGDGVGNIGVTALTNGNYVVSSSTWNNGAVTNAGAATWANGTTGITGTVSATNSLVGSNTNDHVSYNGVAALTNGNYVVDSSIWNNGLNTSAGAATWGNGTTGITGTVSAANSLVGNIAGDNVGDGGVTALTNSNYVVSSPNWISGAIANVGAATWGKGTTGITGVVSFANSLLGSNTNDHVSGYGVTALTNGNYVVYSANWSNGAAISAGAATWGSGTTGSTGFVSTANSLVGSTTNDQVGSGVTALTNGNYLVISPNWSKGAVTFAGAVTWGTLPTPTLISPTGNIATTPAFTWDAASGAQGYYLYVTDGISVIISQSVATSVCSGGVCSFTPASPMVGSSYTWTVEANYGSSGWSSFAPSLAFVIPPTLIAPMGAITNYTPTFTWNNFSNAWGYYIYVVNNSGTVMFAQWVGSSPACTSTTCSFISPITLTGNSYTWWVTAYNGSITWSPWSKLMSFALPLTLIGPSGSIASATPNFTWNAIANAWGYYVYAKNGSTVTFAQWVGSPCNSTTCTFASPVSLPAGSYTWSAVAYGADWGWTNYATPLAFTDSVGAVVPAPVPSATLKPTFQPPVKPTVK